MKTLAFPLCFSINLNVPHPKFYLFVSAPLNMHPHTTGQKRESDPIIDCSEPPCDCCEFIYSFFYNLGTILYRVLIF